MTISLKAAADGLSGTIALGGVDKVTVDSGGIASGIKVASVTSTELATAVKPIGVGQTWQDVKTTPGRSVGTTYTNLTGRPIQIYASFSSSISANLTLTVAGVVIANVGCTTTTAPQAVTAVIPNGATYVVNVSGGTPTVNTWAELF